MEQVTLKSLEPGDIFIHAADKSKRTVKKFLVKGNPVFNRGHGRPTRECIDLQTKEIVGKSCPMLVIKLRESEHKARYMQLAAPHPKVKECDATAVK